MKKLILFTLSVILTVDQLLAQNLVTNPDAESLPRGTGWTIVSQGALTCLLSPTNNFQNWTMKPDGSANYPFDHTTGAAGGTVFFSGCDTYFAGPFELEQTIDLSSDAAVIDLGSQLYTFGGYIQTPVNLQTDQGRFIVDFLDAANAVLGTSYQSNWQSNFGGSGSTWNYYSNTRIAPIGTRKVMIRMLTQLFFNQPAINVYFDDISFKKPIILPLTLLSFTGSEAGANIDLKWDITPGWNLKQFELEQSTDATNYQVIATIPANLIQYEYRVKHLNGEGNHYFFRLKMTDDQGEISYSKIVFFKPTKIFSLKLSPNPANNLLTISGIVEPGNISIINAGGNTVFSNNCAATSLQVILAGFPSGMYTVRFTNRQSTINQKLVIQNK